MLLWAGAVMAQTPAADADPSPFFVEAAECSAAYKAEVTSRLAQPKTESRDQAILADTENSFIFIGVAYKQGLRKAEADELLAQAEQRWAKLPKAAQAQRIASCTERAGKLMDEVSFVERYAVQNRAKARVAQQFEKEEKRKAP